MKLSRKQQKKLEELKKLARRKLQDAFYSIATSIAINSAKLTEYLAKRIRDASKK